MKKGIAFILSLLLILSTVAALALSDPDARVLEYINANVYLSRRGYISQLESEGYDRGAAADAIDSLDLDFQFIATEKGRQYYATGDGFSAKRLYKQLRYEGFTQVEASIGAVRCKPDWQEQAILRAESWLLSTSKTREEIKQILIDEGFPEKMAAYAATNASN